MIISFRGFLFVFFLSFSSFLLGWFSALHVAPKTVLSNDTKYKNTDQLKVNSFTKSNNKNLLKNQKNKMEQYISFFKDLRDSVVFLFNPSETNNLVKNSDHFKKKKQIEKKQSSAVPIVKSSSPPREKIANIPIGIEKSKLYRREKNGKLKPDQYNKKTLDDKQGHSLQDNPFISKEESVFESPSQKKEENYTKSKYYKNNLEQLIRILGSQNFFTRDGQFSFLINAFSEEDEALDYVKSMKKNHPLWSFLLKDHGNHIRIYLGPFKSKQKAFEFQENIPDSVYFFRDFLEEVSL